MQRPRRQFLHLVAGAAALSACARAASAETYPARPIRLVVPFPPGGAFDTLARPWVEKMKPLLGTMVVENIGGGGSSLGAAAVARARPDGYTLLLGGSLPHRQRGATQEPAPLRSVQGPGSDFRLGESVAFALAVHPSVPAQTLKEFVVYAKAHAGQLSYGHAGVGSTNQLTGEMFKLLAGLPEHRASALPGGRAGDSGPNQRTSCHGRGGGDQSNRSGFTGRESCGFLL